MIELDYRSKKPMYEQIVEQIKLLVVKGVLAPGDAIPSVRKMAQELEISAVISLDSRLTQLIMYELTPPIV